MAVMVTNNAGDGNFIYFHATFVSSIDPPIPPYFITSVVSLHKPSFFRPLILFSILLSLLLSIASLTIDEGGADKGGRDKGAWEALHISKSRCFFLSL